MENKTGSSFPNLTRLAKLMDSQFRIPGTNIRFGLDALIGIIPGLGDFTTVMISGAMLVVLARNGASGFLLARMVLNITIDAVFGAIPLVGDIFDVWFKANQRNLKLMNEHYVEGKHQGSALKVIIPVLILLATIVAGTLWLAYVLVEWIVNAVF